LRSAARTATALDFSKLNMFKSSGSSVGKIAYGSWCGQPAGAVRQAAVAAGSSTSCATCAEPTAARNSSPSSPRHEGHGRLLIPRPCCQPGKGFRGVGGNGSSFGPPVTLSASHGGLRVGATLWSGSGRSSTPRPGVAHYRRRGSRRIRGRPTDRRGCRRWPPLPPASARAPGPDPICVPAGTPATGTRCRSTGA
jgi:hypothetical protein